MTDITATLYAEDDEVNTALMHDKQLFYNKLKDYGFDFTDIDEELRLPKSLIKVLARDFNSVLLFNNAMVSLHKNNIVNIADQVVYLITDYVDEEEILKILHTNTLGLLQAAMAAKHNMFTLKKSSPISKFIK